MTDGDDGTADAPAGRDGGEPSGDGDRPLPDRLDRLRDALVATEELPVEREPARWIGEAQAVAADAAASDVEPAVARERVEHVRELLAEVDGTGHEEADALVERAKRLADGICDDAAPNGGR